MKTLSLSASLIALFAIACNTPNPEGDDANSPDMAYVENGREPILDGAKMIYVEHPSLYTPSPKLEVEEWISPVPDIKGKHLLIEYWNTWCPPCRKSLPKLSEIQKEFKDELVVIAICDQPTAEVKAFLAKKPQYNISFAIDTQARMKKTLGVFGVPHATLVEPTENVIVWEGFPLQKGYELTPEVINKFIEVWRKDQKK